MCVRGFPEVMNYRNGQVASQNHRPHPVNSLWRGPPPASLSSTKRQQQFQYEQQQSFYQQQLLATLLLRQRRTTGGSINLQFYHHHHKDTANKSTTTTSSPPPPVLLYKLLDYNNYYNYCRTVNNSSTFNKLQRNVAVAAAAAVQTTVAPFLYVHIPITTQIATVAGDHMGYRRNRYNAPHKKRTVFLFDLADCGWVGRGCCNALRKSINFVKNAKSLL